MDSRMVVPLPPDIKKLPCGESFVGRANGRKILVCPPALNYAPRMLGRTLGEAVTAPILTTPRLLYIYLGREW